MKVKMMLLALLAFLVIVLYTSCPTAPGGGTSSSSTASSAAPQPSFINISNYEFIPQTYYVALGGTVYWTNTDMHNHDVISSNGLSVEVFASPKLWMLESNLSNAMAYTNGWTNRFTVVGTNYYFCSYHIGGVHSNTMYGIIYVTN